MRRLSVLVACLVAVSGATAVADPAAPPAKAHPDLPDPLRALTKTRKSRFAGAWGGYALRGGGEVVALSPDGLHAATSGAEGPVRLWDLETGHQAKLLPGSEPATAAAYSVHGHLLVTGSGDGVVAVWDAETAKPVRAFRRHQGEVGAVAFSPDGKRVASAGEDGTVRLWALGQGRGLVLPGHSDFVRALAFSPDGRQLASGGDDGTVRLWDLTKGRPAKVLGAASEVALLAMAPDGTRLAIARESGQVSVVTLATGEERELGRVSRALGLGFSADGARLLVLASTRREVREQGSPLPAAPQFETRAFDAATGEALPSPAPASGAYGSAVLSADAGRALSGGAAGLGVWEVGSGTLLRGTRGHTGRVGVVAFSSSGRVAVSGADDGTARLWEPGTGRELAVLEGYARDVRVAAAAPDGSRVLAGDATGNLRLWTVPEEPGRVAPAGFIGPHRGVVTLTFADEGRAASASLERTALWDLSTGKEVFSNWFMRIVLAVALSADGKLALATDLVDGPMMREVATGKVLKPLRRDGRLGRSVALTRDGATAAVVTSPIAGPGPDALEIWDTAQGRLLRLVRAPTGLRLLNFSDDGRLLLAAAPDGSVRLFSVKTLKEADRMDLHANGERPTAAAFGPDGLSFLVGTSLGALQQYLVVGDPNR